MSLLIGWIRKESKVHNIFLGKNMGLIFFCKFSSPYKNSEFHYLIRMNCFMLTLTKTKQIQNKTLHHCFCGRWKTMTDIIVVQAGIKCVGARTASWGQSNFARPRLMKSTTKLIRGQNLWIVQIIQGDSKPFEAILNCFHWGHYWFSCILHWSWPHKITLASGRRPRVRALYVGLVEAPEGCSQIISATTRGGVIYIPPFNLFYNPQVVVLPIMDIEPAKSDINVRKK